MSLARAVGERRPAGPPIPDEVTGNELDRHVLAELYGLGRENARLVARRLVMVGALIDEDPDLAWAHAQVARASAGRIAVVREAAGLAAYRAGHYADALAELRTARRISGSSQHLPIMADAERGLGRPERALEMASSPEARTLDADGRVELLIVEAGARRDLGQLDSAVVTLQVPRLEQDRPSGATARLRVAYADALDAAGRREDSLLWLRRAAEVDPDGSSGAAERLDENSELEVYDLEDDLDDLEQDDAATPSGSATPPTDGSAPE
jgi:tetratricopeptide (TPR) repeat protein